MVSVNVPVLVPEVVDTVRVDVAVGFGVTEVGCTGQVAPDGHPLTVRMTVPVNPFSAVAVIVECPDAPRVSVNDLGLRVKEKSPVDAGLTVRDTVVE